MRLSSADRAWIDLAVSARAEYRAGSGQLVIVEQGGDEFEAINLREVDDEALVPCRSRTTLCEVAVDVPSMTVIADAIGLGQLVMNLVSNAADAPKEKHDDDLRACVRLRVSASVEEGNFALEVHDDGPGIPEVLRAKILELFITTKRRGVGTALGLAVVQRMVRQHGGTLTIEHSRELGGALFRAVFPHRPGADAVRASGARVT